MKDTIWVKNTVHIFLIDVSEIFLRCICNCSEQLAIKLRDGCWTLLSVVNKLVDNIVNNDPKDTLGTIPGPDVSIAQDEDFDNGNKESEMDETAYS